MSWSPRFLQDLEAKGVDAPPAMVWAIRTIQVGSEPYGGAYVAATHRHYGNELLQGPPTTQGSKVEMGTWSTTIGGFSFTLTGDLATFRDHVWRGVHVEVLAGFWGYDLSELERVGIGRVTGIRSARGVVTLEIGDAMSLLECRPVTDAAKGTLFYGFDADSIEQTTLSSDYTAGGTTMVVGHTSGFTHPTGLPGALRIGDVIYTYVSGLTTSTEFNATVVAFDMESVDAASGSEVYEVAYWRGHPIDVALNVITSTGAATNGDYDTLPEGWGLGVDVALVDLEDAEAYRDDLMAIASASQYKIDVHSTTEQESPRTWLFDLIAPFGVFPAMRRGRLTIRCATTGGRDEPDEVTDADIVGSWGGISCDWYDPNTASEYRAVLVDTTLQPGSDGNPGDTETLPILANKHIDLASLFFSLNGTSYMDEVKEEVQGRLAPFYKYVAPALTLPLAGLHWMKLCPGDRLRLTTASPHLRYDYGEGRVIFVYQVLPDFHAGTVTVRGVDVQDAD